MRKRGNSAETTKFKYLSSNLQAERRKIKEHIRNDQGKLATKPLCDKTRSSSACTDLAVGRSPHDGGRLTDEVSLRLCPKQ
jgi:hypothetical protein